MEQLLADPDVEIVVNLTIPVAHGDIALAALEAGKHVYGEKPFTVSREQGQKVLALAKEKGATDGLRSRHLLRRSAPDVPQTD